MNSLQTNLDALARNVPTLPYVLDTLDQANISYGLYAGAHVSVLTGNRNPTDIDILVADDDMEKLRAAFPFAATKDDGGWFLYVGHDNDVEFMGRADVIIPEGAYPFRLTELAATKLTTHSIAGRTISLVDPVDTILLKAILQRGCERNKHDLEDIQALLQAVKIDTDYLKLRLSEAGAEERTKELWAKLGLSI